MDRNEIRNLALTLRAGDEVEVGIVDEGTERRASGVLYAIYDVNIYLFGTYITDGERVSGALTFLRIITRAPIPEPTLLGTVVVTDDGRYYVLAHPGSAHRRWYGPEYVPGCAMWMRWGDLKDPRVLTPAEVASLPKAEVASLPKAEVATKTHLNHRIQVCATCWLVHPEGKCDR